MAEKIALRDLKEGHVVDFASIPSLAEKYGYAFDTLEDPADADGFVEFEHWGIMLLEDMEYVSVLTPEEAEVKIKSLQNLLENWPSDDKEYLGRTQQIAWWPEYGEPGYTNPERGILLGNWNHCSKKVVNWLESLGFELEWEDEWIEIDCKVYRSSPTSYGWTPSWCMGHDGETYTRDDHDGVIEALSMTDKGQPAGLLPDWVADAELAAEGYVKVSEEDRESGWFPGQNDTPEKDAVPLFDSGAEAVIFRCTEQSQFYGKWDVWVKWGIVKYKDVPVGGVFFDTETGEWFTKVDENWAKDSQGEVRGTWDDDQEDDVQYGPMARKKADDAQG